jgi:hypothetical protein
MKTVIFVMDESGAKGYSDKAETVPGEFGLMAGYFVPQECLSLICTDLDVIRSQHFNAGKIHITDLEPEAQRALREEIFAYFRRRNIIWTYEAIYVAGFHQHAQFVSELVNEAKAKRRSRIRLSNNKKLDLLHAELFQGAFEKGVSFCLDNVGNECDVKVITDRIDSLLLSFFNEAAKRLLSAGQKKEQRIKGFDLEERKVVEGFITSEVISGLDAIGDFSDISYSIACEDSSLTLAADVLANSAHYHLKRLQENSPGASLNTSKAISGHPLAQLVYGTWQDSETNYIADALYMHPNMQLK